MFVAPSKADARNRSRPVRALASFWRESRRTICPFAARRAKGLGFHLLVGHTQFTKRLLERFNHFRWTTKMHARLRNVRHNAQQRLGGESAALPGPFH